MASNERVEIARERDAALARLERLLARRALLDVVLDPEAVIARAIELSSTYTERIGARAIDLLHVAGALSLESEQFLTTDTRQAHLARSEGMKVVTVVQEEN